MKIDPFMPEELEKFWHEAQSEIYGEGGSRNVDMQHACDFGGFLRWCATMKSYHGTPFEEFDSVSIFNIIESWFKCDTFEQATKDYQP